MQYVTAPNVNFRKYESRPIPSFMGGATTVEIGKSPVMKDFLGFGVALTASSCYELNTMSPDARKIFLEDIYTEKGLNLSLARLTVGSSDYSAELYSYDDVDGDVALEHFSIDRDRDYVIPMIKDALAYLGEDLFLFAAPWSPPTFMKDSGSLIGGGKLKKEFYATYAEYFAKFVEAYAAEGIRISAVLAS